ncbi:MAG: hypothetical protein IT371_30940 [Deltaproteobacteria bacterium]|nr:hypothetical protein [Deltaproteobacteria bacterium]
MPYRSSPVRRANAGAALVLASVLHLAACAAHAPGEGPDELRGKSSPSGTSPSVFGAQPAHLPNVIAQARAMNLSWMRYHLRWDLIEATPGTYAWKAANDSDIAAMAEQNLPAVYIFGTPVWARQPGREGKLCGPIDASQEAAFRAFVRAAVNRYKPWVRYWELWNEPDAAYDLLGATSPYGCWGELTQENYGGEYYARFLKAFSEEVKAADPTAKVLSGGILLGCDNDPGGACANGNAGTNPRFIQGVLEEEVRQGARFFDILAFHSYAYFNSLGKDFQRTAAAWGPFGVLHGKTDYLRRLMGQYQSSRPLLMNEGGLIVSDSCQLSEPIVQNAANEAWRLYLRTWALGLLGSVWYTLDAPGWRCSGLLNEVNGVSPATAVSFLANTLAGATYVGSVGSGVVEGYRFCKGELEYRAYFTNDAALGVQPLPTPPDAVALYDKLGAPLVLGESIPASFEPLLLERRPAGGCKDYRVYLPVIRKN